MALYRPLFADKTFPLTLSVTLFGILEQGRFSFISHSGSGELNIVGAGVRTSQWSSGSPGGLIEATRAGAGMQWTVYESLAYRWHGHFLVVYLAIAHYRALSEAQLL